MTASWVLWCGLVAWAQATPAEEALALLDIEGTDSVPVLVIRAAAPGVVLASCRGVSWERFDIDAGGYVALDSQPCAADGPALPLGEEGLRVPMESAPVNGAVVRAIVVVGAGCTQGMPLPVAGCQRVEAESSGNHTVRISR
jgi:hypothetical protein